MLKIQWCCGWYVGESKWHGLDIFEPDECGCKFETEVDENDWEEEIVTARCPNCGANLTQKWDVPKIIFQN